MWQAVLEAAYSAKMLMNFWITRHIPADSSTHSLHYENLKSGKEISCLFMTIVLLQGSLGQ